MPDPKLTEETLRRKTTARSYSRGKAYYQSGAIINPVQRGNALEAQCEGSQYQPYLVQAMVDNAEIISVSCTCPYDWEGYCKHIIALLLQYIHKPNTFVQKQPLDEQLTQYDKETLVGLVRRMIALHPDLRTLVDQPVPGKTEQQSPVDVDSFRSHLQRAFGHFSGEWGDMTALNALFDVFRSAGEFVAHKEWRSAAAIYQVLLEEGLKEDYRYVMDDDGEFLMTLDDALKELDTCLGKGGLAADDTERQLILEHMLAAYIWDIDYGGVDFGIDVPDYLLTHAKRDDLPVLRQRIYAARERKAHLL